MDGETLRGGASSSGDCKSAFRCLGSKRIAVLPACLAGGSELLQPPNRDFAKHRVEVHCVASSAKHFCGEQR